MQLYHSIYENILQMSMTRIREYIWFKFTTENERMINLSSS